MVTIKTNGFKNRNKLKSSQISNGYIFGSVRGEPTDFTDEAFLLVSFKVKTTGFSRSALAMIFFSMLEMFDGLSLC